MSLARRSVRVANCGGPEVLKYIPNDTPIDPSTLGPNQVIVRQTYAGLNFIDTYFRTGLYQNPPSKPFPFVPGSEGCGVVTHVGAEVPPERKLQVGQRVGYIAAAEGSYSSMTVHNADDLIPLLPSANNLPLPDDQQVAASLIQGLTAHYLTDGCYRVNDQSTVVLNAAAGGTGLLLSQICKLRGAKQVIAIAGGPEKAALARATGKADVVVDYKTTPDWVAEVKKIAPQGVDAFYDAVGKTTFDGTSSGNAFSLLKRRGAMVTFGNASGAVPPILPLELTKYGSVSLQRPKLFDFVDRPSGEFERRLSELLGWIAGGKLKLTVSKVMKLSEAAEAHALLEAGKTTGKILFDCQQAE